MSCVFDNNPAFAYYNATVRAWLFMFCKLVYRCYYSFDFSIYALGNTSRLDSAFNLENREGLMSVLIYNIQPRSVNSCLEKIYCSICPLFIFCNQWIVGQHFINTAKSPKCEIGTKSWPQTIKEKKIVPFSKILSSPHEPISEANLNQWRCFS